MSGTPDAANKEKNTVNIDAEDDTSKKAVLLPNTARNAESLSSLKLKQREITETPPSSARHTIKDQECDWSIKSAFPYASTEM